jgi:hypothetical protein
MMDKGPEAAVTDISIKQRQCPHCFLIMKELPKEKVIIVTEGTDETSILRTFQCKECDMKRHIRGTYV